eukprot:gene11226-12523_t
MTTFALIKKCCPSKLVNAWKVRIGAKIFLVTPANVCVYGERGHWTMSHFLKELSFFDWKISASYVSNPNPFYDLAWTELAWDGSQSSKDEDECIVLGSRIQAPTKVDVFFRQPLDYNGTWVSERSEIGQTEAILYPSPSPAQLSESEGDIDTGDLVEAVDIGFHHGMSGALAMRRHPHHDTGPITCEGMFIKRGSLRSLKKSSLSRLPLDLINYCASTKMDESTTVIFRPPHQGKYNGIQKAMRRFLGIDIMEDMLEYIGQNGLIKADLHEIGVVID